MYVNKPIITVSAIILIAMLATLGATAKAQTDQANTQVILNLLNGQQYFGIPRVYQGDNQGAPTNSWPTYYGPSTASRYWSPISTNINQPVLELVPAKTWSAGAMFWQAYYSGGPVIITMVGTFSSGSSADGFVIYLFLPSSSLTWSVSSAYNYSINYKVSKASPIQGGVIFPQSSAQYIVVQWDPVWQIYAKQSGATGQWNVFIASNPGGNNPSVGPIPSPNLGGRYAGWGGIGTGAFQPRPGDRINITVTYDPSTNILTGIATNLNTRQSAQFSLSLSGYYTPPSIGNYVFGVGAATGDGYANWALLYVATKGLYTSPPTPTTSPTSTSVTTTTITITTTSVVTSTVTSLITSTITSPTTTTVTSTVTVPVTVTTTVLSMPDIVQTVIIALIIIIVVLAVALVAVTIRKK